jgi:predicted ATPase
MNGDRITEIRIAGMRCFDDVRLRLGELTVLIGENGSGKSTVVEACELLRKAGADSSFVDRIASHGGLLGLRRVGADRMALGLTIQGKQGRIDYDFSLAREGERSVVHGERLVAHRDDEEGEPVITRDRSQSLVRDRSGGESGQGIFPGSLLVSAFGLRPPHPAIERARDALESIRVQLPFDVQATWGAASLKRESLARRPSQLEVAPHLSPGAANLADAYFELRSSDNWPVVLDSIRLGLGEGVSDVLTVPVGGGNHSLAVRYEALPEAIPVSGLSDGTICYLAFVALCMLPDKGLLLAIDEPELHLHPGLLARVLSLLEATADDRPVLVATHSDRLLDALSDPAKQTVVCDLEERSMKARLRCLDRRALDSWLESYAGLGEIRADGFDDLLVAAEEGGDES